MNYVRVGIKLFLTAVILLGVSGIGMAVNTSAAEAGQGSSGLQVVDPYNAVIAALIMVIVGVFVFWRRNRAND